MYKESRVNYSTLLSLFYGIGIVSLWYILIISESKTEVTQILEHLNPAQKAAVVNYEKPSLIVAGAGSGKTRVLTSRVAYMLQQGVEPWRILALTFTNKAAAEMRDRIGKVVPQGQSERLWMGTFHSIFLRILRMEVDKIGYPSSFTIYDTDDGRNLIRSVIKELNLNDEYYKPNQILSRISLAKNNLVTAQAYESNTVYRAEDREKKIPEFVEVYKSYARKCRENAAMDFDDILLNMNILLRDFPEVLQRYQQRFHYILVDEYQDTNYAQYIIIRRLAELHRNICVVGDDAQSIYSFRGAKIENILRFRNDYPEAQTFKLEQNYRSTQNIVNAANSVIEKNKNRLEKASFSKGEQGEKIYVLKAYTDQEEAAIVADRIRDRVRDSGAEWSEVAILYRTNMQSRVFEESLRRRSIPYRIYGGISFYQRAEIKNLLGYIKLIVNPQDNEAFNRVINYPARGIGKVTMDRIEQAAQSGGVSRFEIAQSGNLRDIGLNGGAEKRVREFAEMIAELSLQITTLGIYQFGLEVATRSGILGILKAEQSPEAQSALDNIEELLNSMQLFSEEQMPVMEFDQSTGEPIEGESLPASVVDWLQNVALITDMDRDDLEQNNRVTLMTIHAAKGLEYRFVFIVGLEENLFPSIISMNGAEGLEEERRLFYVALTRAQEEAVLSFSQTRFKWGSMEFCRPSRFLSEIEPQYLEIDFELEDTESDQTDEEAGQQRGRRYGVGGGRYGVGGGRYGGPRSRGSERVEVVTPKTGAGARYKSIGGRPIKNIDTTTQERRESRVVVAGVYEKGQRVNHSKFGLGIVVEVEEFAGDSKITVMFDDQIVGKKRLLSKFAKLEVVG